MTLMGLEKKLDVAGRKRFVSGFIVSSGGFIACKCEGAWLVASWRCGGLPRMASVSGGGGVEVFSRVAALPIPSTLLLINTPTNHSKNRCFECLIDYSISVVTLLDISLVIYVIAQVYLI
jgi:hypothetical protein